MAAVSVKRSITLLSHPQIAYELIEAGGAEDILQNKKISKRRQQMHLLENELSLVATETC